MRRSVSSFSVRLIGATTGDAWEGGGRRRAVHQSSSASTSPDCAPNKLGCSPPADHGFLLLIAGLRSVQLVRATTNEGSFESGMDAQEVSRLVHDSRGLDLGEAFSLARDEP